MREQARSKARQQEGCANVGLQTNRASIFHKQRRCKAATGNGGGGRGDNETLRQPHAQSTASPDLAQRHHLLEELA
jgi:hypothetical protein